MNVLCNALWSVCIHAFVHISIPRLTTCTCLHTHYMYFSAGDQDGVDNSSLVREQSFNFGKLLVFLTNIHGWIIYDLIIPTDQTPSDIGLLAVWRDVPKWELPLNLGVFLTDVDSLRQEGKDGIEALRILRSGRCKGFPPTWTSLLNAVERVEGPEVRERLSSNVGVDKTWIQCK